MPLFYINFDGAPDDDAGVECDSIEEARNEAVSRLGEVLQRDPSFANAGHWRVDVLDRSHRLQCHVIVATVNAAQPLNFASYETAG